MVNPEARGFFVWSVTFKSGSTTSRGELDLRTCEGKIAAFALDCKASATIHGPDGDLLVSTNYAPLDNPYSVEKYRSDMQCSTEQFITAAVAYAKDVEGYTERAIEVGLDEDVILAIQSKIEHRLAQVEKTMS